MIYNITERCFFLDLTIDFLWVAEEIDDVKDIRDDCKEKNSITYLWRLGYAK